MNKLEKADLPFEELFGLEQLIASVNWRDSTTYPPDMQHAYILRKNGPAVFETLRKAIEKYGYTDDFAGKTQVYLVIGQHKYWSYDTVLNREDVQLTLNRQANLPHGG